MTVIVSNDALSKLRQEARSRRQAALMIEARRRPPAPRPTYEATKPQIKVIARIGTLTNSVIERVSSTP